MPRPIKDLVLGTLFSAFSAWLLYLLVCAREPAARTSSPSPASSFLEPVDDPQKIASYDIRATLDPVLHTVNGLETIHFVNRSQATLTQLFFHLYLNAFKNDKTLFLRSPFGAGRSGDKAHQYGYVDVKKLLWVEAGNRDLWPSRDTHSPNDPDDETDLRVPLPEPVEPGQTLTLELEFEDKLPEIIERTGYKGSFHFVGQWFPKLARLEKSGQFSHFAFHAQSEFDSDFGDYDVTLTLPKSYLVGATGSLDQQSESKEKQTLRYRAANVHDFAFAAWDHFQIRRERIAGTAVSVLYPPDQDANAISELDSVRFALPHFNALYGRYPYPTLTLVHPPEEAANAGGMEYPTLITTGGAWYSTLGGAHVIAVVTTHELGHQWFYGLCASDEHAFPFLDEGLNSYAEAEALEARYGAGSVFHGFGLSVSENAVNRAISGGRGADEPVAQGAADFASFRNLGALVYGRTATILSTMARVYGRERLLHALGSYTRAFRFAHPAPSDLLRVVRDELGADAASVLSSALFERGTVDYLVREISNAPETAAAGVFDGPTGRQHRKPEPVGPAGRYRGQVVVYRHGSLEFPVEIELVSEASERQTQYWDGHGFTHKVEYTGTSRLVAVSVDPKQRILLDDDLSNNWVSIKGGSAPRTFERAVYVGQSLLGALGP